jgi:hypothetical protein
MGGMEQCSHGPLRLRVTFVRIQMLRERKWWSLVLCDTQDRRKRWVCWNRQSDQSSVCWVHLCMRRMKFKCNPVCFLGPGLPPSWIQSEFHRLSSTWSSVAVSFLMGKHQDHWLSSESDPSDHGSVISVPMNDTLAFVQVRMCPSVKINILLAHKKNGFIVVL